MRRDGTLSMRRTDVVSSSTFLSREFAFVRPCVDASLL